MNALELMRNRRSVRSYAATPVENEKIEYVLEAGRVAPSAVNYQPWHFLLVREAEGCENIRKCYPREWFRSAPSYLVICGDHGQSWKRGDGKDHMDIDAAIATEHMCLAAAEQGLGTCWVCNFDTILCRELFHLPDSVEPVAILPLGYPAADSLGTETPKKRKSLEEIVKRETF